MTLVTWTRSPPSWAARLPQKFSAATTWIWVAARTAASACMLGESTDNHSQYVFCCADERLDREHDGGTEPHGTAEQRRPAGRDRAARAATLLRHRPGDLRQPPRRGPPGWHREHLPQPRAAHPRRLRPARRRRRADFPL